jgi:phage repressor protein C with HTH and peptisase S24 domain
VIGDNIKRRRIELGLSQEDLARAVGKKQQNIQQLESGVVEQPRYLKRLLRALNCSYEQLLSGNFGIPKEQNNADEMPRFSGLKYTPVREPDARYSSMHIQAYDEDEELDSARYACLKVVDAELSAGGGFKNGDLLFEDKPLPFLRSTLNASGVREDKALVVRIIGNSMEPVLSSGDTVGVNWGDKSPIKDGKPYAIRDIDMIRVKLLYQRPGGGLRIRSFNSSEYPDEDLTVEEVEERITIIGRVFWSSRMW